MPNITGGFIGKITAQTMLSVNDTPDHELFIRQCVGKQRVSDALFSDQTCTTSSTSDLLRGNGEERGHFVNKSANGELNCGSYECKVTNTNGQITMEGTWKYTSGTGQFEGITGGGTFKARLTSPTEVDLSYEGSYQLKAGKRAA